MFYFPFPPRQKNLDSLTDGAPADRRVTEREIREHIVRLSQSSRVVDWVRFGIGLPQYADSFRSNNVVVADFPMLVNDGYVYSITQANAQSFFERNGWPLFFYVYISCEFHFVWKKNSELCELYFRPFPSHTLLVPPPLPPLASLRGALLETEFKVLSALHRQKLIRGMQRQLLALGQLPSAPRQLACFKDVDISGIVLTWMVPEFLGQPLVSPSR